MPDSVPLRSGDPLSGNGCVVALAEPSDADWHDDLMRRHWTELHRWTKNKVSVTADAEDIAQTAMTVAWIKRDQVRSPAYEPLTPWLFVVARNIVRNYHSRRLGRHRWSYLVTLDDELPVPAPDLDEPEAALLARAEIEHLLSLLTRGQERILRVMFLQDHDYHEAAELLDMSEDAVMMARWRALRAARPHAIALGLGRARPTKPQPQPQPPAEEII